jgi:hypothetical protein
MKNITGFILLLLTALLLISMHQCVHEKRAAKTNLLALTDTVQHYTSALGTQTAVIRTLQTDQKQLKGVLLEKDKEFAAVTKQYSKVHSVTKFNTVTRIDTIAVRYTDTIPCIFSRKGTVQDKWYSFTFKATQNGLHIDSLTLPNNTFVVTGTKRKWFLGKETVTTEVTHTNPYLHTRQLQASEVRYNTPIGKKWYLWLAVGITGGFLLAK